MARANVAFDKRLSKTQTLTAEELRSLVDYNPDTGAFTWLRRIERDQWVVTWNKKWAGKPAGTTMSHGYRAMRVNDVPYLCHRLAWLHVTGEWPRKLIDHINGDKADNRFCNLREATNSENLFNSIIQDNHSGHRGVSLHKASGMWHAQIHYEGRAISLGYHHSPELASVAYQTAARLIRGKWIRTARERGFAPPPVG